MALDVKTAGSTFEPGTPKELFDHRFSGAGGGHNVYQYLPYAVSADGQRFLIPRAAFTLRQTDSPPSNIVVVLNWTQGLEK